MVTKYLPGPPGASTTHVGRKSVRRVDVDTKTIVARYKAGEGIRAIGQSYDPPMSYGAVRSRLLGAGVELRRRGNHAPRRGGKR